MRSVLPRGRTLTVAATTLTAVLIVANVGNSATDLGGGHAERTFKLPDYDGRLD